MQKKKLENKCVTIWCNKLNFLLKCKFFFVKKNEICFIGIHTISLEVNNQTTLNCAK